MPFAVFRRHQRKLLAIFAILAMFGFVVADSLPRLLSGGYGGRNQNPVGRHALRQDRSTAATLNADGRSSGTTPTCSWPSSIAPRGEPARFGDLDDPSLVDALILQHEADRLGMPAGPEVGREWLKQTFGQHMNRETFERSSRRFNNQVSGEQILGDIANQVRLAKVQQLLGSPVVTPLDVFQTYRDQNERVSARAAGFPVEDFVAKVARAVAVGARGMYYDKYKDVLPDPARDTPGFKIPRQIRVEILSIDGDALRAGSRTS